MGVFEAAEHRLLVVVAGELAIRRSGHNFFEMLVAAGESPGVHPLRRLNGDRRLLGIGKVHRPKLTPEEAGRCERFDLLVLADAFQTLTDVDKGRHDRVAGPEHATHPRA